MHKNAVTTPASRGIICRRIESGETLAYVGRAMRLSVNTIRKWWQRYLELGPAGLEDRSSRPHCSPRRTPEPLETEIKRMRSERRCGRAIAKDLTVSPATVSRILRRAGMSRWSDLEPKREVIRYEREHPGDLLHLDIKQLGRIGERTRFQGDQSQRSRGIGHEYVHVAVDDRSRYAVVTVADDQTHVSACVFLDRTVSRFAELGVTIRRVLTDNGSCYKSGAFRGACKRLGITHKFTRPYTPRTNGKAERFIQTALREWAYGSVFPSSAARTTQLAAWLHHYNWHRPHGGVDHRPPSSRLPLDSNNVLIAHT